MTLRGCPGLTFAPELFILEELRRFENQLAGAFRRNPDDKYG